MKARKRTSAIYGLARAGWPTLHSAKVINQRPDSGVEKAAKLLQQPRARRSPCSVVVRRQIDVGQTVNDDGAGRRGLPLPPYPGIPFRPFTLSVCSCHSGRALDQRRGCTWQKLSLQPTELELRNGINPVPGEGAGGRSTLTLPQKEVSP